MDAVPAGFSDKIACMPSRDADREQRFIAAYLGVAKQNATQAARLAGYGAPAVTGCRLLKRANVQQSLARARQKVIG